MRTGHGTERTSAVNLCHLIVLLALWVVNCRPRCLLLGMYVEKKEDAN